MLHVLHHLVAMPRSRWGSRSTPSGEGPRRVPRSRPGRTACKIHRLTTGRVRGPRRPRGPRRYLVRYWSDETLPVHAFLIEHPGGLWLVDTGQTAAAAQPGFLPLGIPSSHRPLRAQGRRHGGPPTAQARIRVGERPLGWCFTHLHTDRVGGVGDFSGSQHRRVSKHSVEPTPRDFAVTSSATSRGNGPAESYRGSSTWTRPALGPFATTLDLVGDGSIVLVPLPGTPPGQIGVLVARSRRDRVARRRCRTRFGRARAQGAGPRRVLPVGRTSRSSPRTTTTSR